MEGVYNEVITKGYTENISAHDTFKQYTTVFNIVKASKFFIVCSVFFWKRKTDNRYH
jgi:hypothetical protein